MQRYSVYIVKHLLSATALITVSLTSIIWLTQALRFIDFIVRKGISFGSFLELTLLMVPSLLLFILPFALLFALLHVYYRLMMDSELLVLSNAGLSRLQVARPAVVVAGIVGAVGYLISLWLLPVTYGAYKDMQYFLRDNYATLMLQEDVFNNPVDRLTVYIHDREKDGTMHGIFVHDSRDESKPPTTMMAEEGRLIETAQGPRFLLQRGNRQEVENGNLSILNFEEYTLDISFYSAGGKRRARQPEEMSVTELLSPSPTDPEASRLRAEGHNRITWPLLPLPITLLAMGMLLGGEFNRRGQWQRVVKIILLGVVVICGAIGLLNLSFKHSWMIGLMYLLILLPSAFGLWMLTHDRRARRAYA